MDEMRVIEVKQSVFADNDRVAEELRGGLRGRGIFLLNLMSSPGAGKTTLLSRTIEALSGELSMAVMDADIDSVVDAQALAAAGARSVQIHTGGMCHLDASMMRQALGELLGEGEGGTSDRDPDLVFLENVGNLVCPAEFDTGASRNAMILSVPEGDDKPLKYPLMFQVCDLVLVNKMDACCIFDDFSLERAIENIHMRNPDALVIPLSAKTGEGMEAWYDWLRREVAAWKAAAGAEA